MHYFGYVSLGAFYIPALREGAVSDENQALAVVHDDTCLEVCELAARLGLSKGMRFREAKSLARGSCRFAVLKDHDFQEHQETWLKKCLLFSDCIEPGLPHEAWIDLSAHAQPLEIAYELFRQFPGAQFGVARSKWLSKIVAFRSEPASRWDLLQQWRNWTDQPAEQLAPLPTRILSLLQPSTIDRLIYLGYRTVGEVAQISFPLLKKQFGAEAQLIRQAAIGEVYDRVLPIFPRDSYAVDIQIQGGASTFEELESTLAAPFDQIGRRLAAIDKCAQQIHLEFIFESGKSVARQRTFQRPIVDSRTLWCAYRLIQPTIVESVIEVRVSLPKLQAKVRNQRRLDDRAEQAENALRVHSALTSLKSVYGDQSVVPGSEVMIPRRKQVLRAWCDATGWR